jgi:ABC-2 type transport system permease protein
VNRSALGTFLWLRWRIRINQLRRGGIVSAIILGILLAVATLASLAGFVILLLIGVSMRGASANSVMYVWDGLVGVFLLFWITSLLTELQRSETLSLDKFLHLPVSSRSVFVSNYLSSLLNVSNVLFVPAMVAFGLGLTLVHGPVMLIQLPLLAALLLAITALTYQFQGWLAVLMLNPRRRRTIVVLVTAILVLVSQLPNVVNMYFARNGGGTKSWSDRFDKHKQLLRDLSSGKIDQVEYKATLAKLEREQAEAVETTFDAIRMINLFFPPGWLPLGAAAAVEGNPVPALLGILGLGLVGTVSLVRSYRTTVRVYTGHYNTGKMQERASPSAVGRQLSAGMLDREIPVLPGAAAAVALASLRSLVRAPEAKMMLLSPIILVAVFGGMLLGRSSLPESVSPWLSFGAIAITLFSMLNIMGNQFGFDRGGFRVFVLCGAPRRDILLGKNLAFAPLAMGMGTILLVLLQVLYPARLDHFLAAFPQMVSMFLAFCVVTNLLSILGPIPIAPGSFKRHYATGLPLLLHIAAVFLLPIVMAPTLAPLAIENLLEALDWSIGLPVCLILAVAECALLTALYPMVVGWEGRLLQSRERRILETVTAKI